jgi:hypothetical protein
MIARRLLTPGEGCDMVTCGKCCIEQMRADEAGAAGNR